MGPEHYLSHFSNKIVNLDTDFKLLKKNMQEIFDQIQDDATPQDIKSQFTDTLIVSPCLQQLTIVCDKWYKLILLLVS